MTSSPLDAHFRALAGLLCILPGCAAPDLCTEGVFAFMEDGKTWEQGDEREDDRDSEDLRLEDGDEVHICPGEWTVEVSAFLDDGGAATISGAEDGSSGFANGGVHQAFYTAGPGHLTFKNLFFRDGLILDLGRAAGFGAAMDQVTLESVVIEGNTAFSGGGLSLGPSSEVTIRNSRVVNNRAEMAGGGAALPYGFSRLVSENTDWGSGEDDNTPDDIAITDGLDEVLGSWSFGDNASFVCSWEDRTCE